MMFAYSSIVLMVHDHWTWATLVYSFAVSIKMNVIFMAPAFGVLILQRLGLRGLLQKGLLGLGLQIALAVPFLQANWVGYLARSFELGRVFMFKWTVNFKFLPEVVFQSKELALGLVILTVLTWVAFGDARWAARNGGLQRLFTFSLRNVNRSYAEQKLR